MLTKFTWIHSQRIEVLIGQQYCLEKFKYWFSEEALPMLESLISDLNIVIWRYIHYEATSRFYFGLWCAKFTKKWYWISDCTKPINLIWYSKEIFSLPTWISHDIPENFPMVENGNFLHLIQRNSFLQNSGIVLQIERDFKLLDLCLAVYDSIPMVNSPLKPYIAAKWCRLLKTVKESFQEKKQGFQLYIYLQDMTTTISLSWELLFRVIPVTTLG